MIPEIIFLMESDSISSVPPVSSKYTASRLDVYWIGITIVLGGQIINWNKGLQMGYYEFCISVIVSCLGYISLTLCLSEMTSVLPFAGGSYGYVRCSLGPLFGYLVGFCEGIQYILYVAAALLAIGTLFRDLFQSSFVYQPAYWLLFYSIALPFQIMGGVYFWRFGIVIGMLTVGVVVAWCLMDLDHADIRRYDAVNQVAGDSFTFMRYFPYSAWFFKGIEAMTMTCEDVAQPQKTVPQSILISMGSVSFFALCVILTAGSVIPGPHNLINQMHPYDPLIQKTFDVTHQLGTIMMFPGAIGTAYGFMYAFSHQLHAMASSGLMPRFLSWSYGPNKTPAMALLVGSLLSYLCALVMYFALHDPVVVTRVLFSICMLGSCGVYLSLLRAFVVYKTRYSSLDRHFTNPLGYVSVFVGALVFAFMMLCLAFFGQDQYVALVVFIGLLGLGSMYYKVVAQKREYFSKEEQDTFMKAYIVNANVHRRKMNKKARGSFFLAKIFPLTNGREVSNLVAWDSKSDSQVREVSRHASTSSDSHSRELFVITEQN